MRVFRKKPTYVPPAPGPPLGFVLLAEPITTTAGVVALIEGTLGVSIEVEPSSDDQPGIMQVFGPAGAAFISIVNGPVPYGEAEAAAARNYFWAGGTDRVGSHSAHMLVTVLGGSPDEQVTDRSKVLTRVRMFIDLLSVLLGIDAAIGVYIGAQQVTHEAAPFRDLAIAAAKQDELPLPLLVHIMAAPQQGGGSAGYTCGLPVFGHDDLEVIDSARTPDEVYDLLANVAAYLLTSDVHLMPGETLGFTDEMRLPIRLADEAHFIDGRALQIGF